MNVLPASLRWQVRHGSSKDNQELVYVPGILWKELSLLEVVQFVGVNVWRLSNTLNSIIMENRTYVDHIDTGNYLLQ